MWPLRGSSNRIVRSLEVWGRVLMLFGLWGVVENTAIWEHLPSDARATRLSG